MYEKAFCLMALSLSLIGVVSLIKMIALKVIFPIKNDRIFTMVPLYKNSLDAEYALRCAVTRLRWMGIRENAVIVLDCGVSDEVLTVCETMEKMYSEVILLKIDDLKKYLSSNM